MQSAEIEKTKLDRASQIVHDTLMERFEGEFVFDPIVATPYVDVYGGDGDFLYLQIYIVFDGDQKQLDTGWLVGFIDRLIPLFEAEGIEGFPSPAYVAKKEWPWLEKKLRKAGRLAIA